MRACSCLLGLTFALVGCGTADSVTFPRLFDTSDGDGGSSAGAGGMFSSGQGGSGGAAAGAGPVGTGGGGVESDCVAGEIGACGAGYKCAVIDPLTGKTACIEAGPRPLWSRCLADEECVEGSWCDGYLGVCKPYCKNGNSCPAEGQCLHPKNDQQALLEGLRVCSAGCAPDSAEPCNDSFGATTCVLFDKDVDGFDCAVSDNKQEGIACTYSPECARGLGCFGKQPNGVCLLWCNPVSYDQLDPKYCKGGLGICSAVSPKAVHDGHEYGACIY